MDEIKPKKRLSGVTFQRDNTSHDHEKYSRVIKRIQFILPLIALILILTIMNWNRFENEAITPIQERAQEIVKANIGKNELIHPEFKSIDDKNQPFTLTADRATQNDDDQDLILLEQPNGELKMNSGEIISIHSKEGTYSQNTQNLFLSDTVELYYDQTYEMNTEQLYIDMKDRKAWTDVDVSGQGPRGTLEAKGMKAQSLDDSIIFTGPAKLVLFTEDNAFGFGGLPQ